MVTACQELDQLERAGIDKLINSLTSIKFAGGVSASDATKLAKEMDTDAETIRTMPELTFAAWLKHHGTGTYKVTPGLLEKQIDQDTRDVDALKAMMLSEYHYAPDTAAEDATSGEDDPGEEPDYDTSWDDEPSTAASHERNTQAKPKPDADTDKPVDPDAPQDLD